MIVSSGMSVWTVVETGIGRMRHDSSPPLLGKGMQKQEPSAEKASPPLSKTPLFVVVVY
jgi:hypothetical protein